MIRSTMQDYQLTTGAIMRHGARVYGGSECVTWTGAGTRRASYATVAQNAGRLAGALARLGIKPGDPVATFCWNNTEHLEAYFGVPMSPVGGMAIPPAGVEAGTPEDLDWRMRAGRVIHGVEMWVVGKNGEELPWDGVSEGEIEVRGPWVTGSYHHDPAPEKFRAGWLRTGDVGTIDERGFFTITDRIKDVIKSGGEWISSVELENQLMAHPAVQEAAVIGMPDTRWGERPLASVVLRPGMMAKPAELADFLTGKLACWQVPENWTFVAEIPKTAVGKFDKKVLRARLADGDLEVERTGS